ncbi:Zinc carboxypeptidase A 1 [Zootermopsis nevadensis]|uniref:Zinc carboxypeptidase A 1 n=2 Tax=Zootermopsis nevadensis TaxID=136037 RepID=A0A067RG70_ZOONE|nr:Zinc carboxypeptidase A 1 [Zootermopsis nevadensis]
MMVMKWWLCLLLAVLVSAKVRYDRHQVFRLVPEDKHQLQALRDLEEQAQELDFWTSPRGLNTSVDIMVPPHLLRDFYNMVRKNNLKTKIFIKDVQKAIDNEKPAQNVRAGYGWTDYYDLDETNDYLRSLAEDYPDIVQLYVGGSSYEGRDILGVKLSYKDGNPKIFIESGIHAREWICPSLSTWILNQLLTSEDPDVRSIAENFDWYVFPSVNPDGYQYSHTTNRMWRKTLTPGTVCNGVDPNRNWDDHWNEGGASSNECSEIYAGTGPFSTVETASLAETIKELNPTVYFSFHSYSQLLMVPFGHRHETADNYYKLLEIGSKAAHSLSQRYGTQYVVGSIINAIYEATGGSMDWAKSKLNVPYTFEWELRDEGQYGFLLPAEQIIPTALETFDSIITILKEVSAAVKN